MPRGNGMIVVPAPTIKSPKLYDVLPKPPYDAGIMPLGPTYLHPTILKGPLVEISVLILVVSLLKTKIPV